MAHRLGVGSVGVGVKVHVKKVDAATLGDVAHPVAHAHRFAARTVNVPCPGAPEFHGNTQVEHDAKLTESGVHAKRVGRHGVCPKPALPREAPTLRI